jgi:hypothetical protein
MVMIEPSLQKNQKVRYEIQMIGCISQRWAGWFGDMTILDIDDASQGCISTVSIEVVDQAALLGALHKLHSLGFSLVEVRLNKEAVSCKGSVG